VSTCSGLLWTRKRGLVPSPKGGSHLLLGLHNLPPNSTAENGVWQVVRAGFFGPSSDSGVFELGQHSGFSSVVLCEEVDHRP